MSCARLNSDRSMILMGAGHGFMCSWAMVSWIYVWSSSEFRFGSWYIFSSKLWPCKFRHLSTGSGYTWTRPSCFLKDCKNVVFPDPMLPSTTIVYGCGFADFDEFIFGLLTSVLNAPDIKLRADFIFTNYSPQNTWWNVLSLSKFQIVMYSKIKD